MTWYHHAMVTRREALRALAVLGGGLVVGCDGELGAIDGSVGRDGGRRADAGNPRVDDPSDGGDAIPDASDAGHSALVLGETKPSALNTGLNVEGIQETALTVIAGNVTHATNDVVFDRCRFTGKVSIAGKRITYRNCWFNGSHAAGQALAQCSNPNCEEIVFENCLFRPSSFATSATEALANVVFGHDFRLLRCDLSGAVDCVGLYSGVNSSTPARNVEILGSFLHDMTYFSPDPGHADNQTHNDAVQVHFGVHHLRVFGTTIVASVDPAHGQASEPPMTGSDGAHLGGNKYYPGLYAMSGFMFSPRNETAGVVDVEIDRCWLSGGLVHINWPREDGIDVRITRNRWGDPTYHTTGSGDPMYVLMRAGQEATISGNTFEDTGLPYDRRSNG